MPLYAIHFTPQILVAADDEDAALDLAEAVARDQCYAVETTVDDAKKTGLLVYLDEGRAPFLLCEALALMPWSDEEESE